MGGSSQSSECCICIRRFLPLSSTRRRLLFDFISDPIVRPKQLHSKPTATRACGIVDAIAKEDEVYSTNRALVLSRAVCINRFSMTRLLSFYCFCEIESSVG